MEKWIKAWIWFLKDGYREYYYKNNDKFIGYYKDLKYDELEHI